MTAPSLFEEIGPAGRRERGRAHVVHEEGPGGTLGEVPLFDGGGYPATAIAQAATRCAVYTPQGLAESLGTVRKVVVRSLRGLRRRGIISSAGRGRYRVTDARALDMAAGA
jgi:CRP-like cAMP-binding protein